MIRAIMHGCNGHMGQTITGLCADDEQIEIVAGVGPFDGIKNDYPGGGCDYRFRQCGRGG